MHILFSWNRLIAIILKEFIQMKRDRMTFGMMIGVPLMQLTLFGFAINSDPKNLPTVIVADDQSVFTRSLITDLQNSQYFEVLPGNFTRLEAAELLKRGKVQFAIYFPQNFSNRLVRGEKPELLIEADATDPAATSQALSIIQTVVQRFAQTFTGSLYYLRPAENPVHLVTQAKYNPNRITQYNIVPGLLGVVLTMTMVVITSLAMTRERERGTMEALLAMPVRPIEVMLGKLIPYIVVGYIQISFILTVAHWVFHVPIHGSIGVLLMSCFPFIIANLGVGLTFSTLAKNQLQAMQSSFFFFLPSLLLSGFMFPFHGMPTWAQTIGSALPLTHFLLIVRGILLKGNGFVEIFPDLAAICIFFVIMFTIGVRRYRQTLD